MGSVAHMRGDHLPSLDEKSPLTKQVIMLVNSLVSFGDALRWSFYCPSLSRLDTHHLTKVRSPIIQKTKIFALATSGLLGFWASELNKAFRASARALTADVALMILGLS